MTDIKLSKNQKDDIRKLLEIKADEDDDFFSNLEYLLRDTFLPPKGSRKFILKEKIALLREISQDAKKLLSKLNRLDPYFVRDIDSRLAHVLGAPQILTLESLQVDTNDPSEHFPNSVVPLTGYPDISSKKAVRAISEESLFIAEDYAESYGRGYMDLLIESLMQAFPKKITASLDSDFVKFVAIILEEDSLEKIYQQVLRSKAFKDIKKYKNKL